MCCVVCIVIACLENGDAFIFYAGFGVLLYSSLRFMLVGVWSGNVSSVLLTVYDGFAISRTEGLAWI